MPPSTRKRFEDSVNELATITGQPSGDDPKPKSPSRPSRFVQGQAIGCKVTLRGLRMYEFFDKLVSIALPACPRDFRGISKNAFDGHGKLHPRRQRAIDLPRRSDYDKVSKIRGMDIVVVTTAQSDAEAFAFLQEMGMPFRK